MKTRATKKTAWILSLISLLLCVSMLVGTTFAWFTDTVTSGINTIAAGVLDVELYHTNAAAADQKVNSTTKLFLDVNGDPILWEPGVVSWENLRIENAGDLALNWKLSINTANENYVIDPLTNAYNGLSTALKVGFVPGGITATEREAVVASVNATDWTTLSSFSTKGQLLPEGEGTYEETVGIVIWWEPGHNDNLWNLNNGKQLSSGEVLSIDLGVHLVAQQQVFEDDSFGNDYDAEASYAFSGSYSHSSTVATNADSTVAVDTTMGNTDGVVSAQVPAGTKLEAGTTDMTLSVTTMDTVDANITVGDDETANSVDVHVSGLAADNTVPVLVTVKHLLPKYMNQGNFSLYHDENGTPVLMTQVADPVNHNEYSYDPLTGDVTMALANFCAITPVIKNVRTWAGVTAQAFSGGDGTESNPYLIANADQLALMSKLISGNTAVTYKGITCSDYADANYKLAADIVFPGQEATSLPDDDSLVYYPAGYWFSDTNDSADKPIYKYNKSFTGTFDGAGHSITGIYQNTWLMNGEYNDGYSGTPNYWKAAMGLFGAVYGESEEDPAVIKNLTIVKFTSDGEFTPTGCVAAFAGGYSVFENISLEHCNPRVYNTGNGGIVGLNYNDTDGSADNLTFKNITVDETNKISALWGSYDVSCGGILGRLRDNDKHTGTTYNKATFINCHVAAEMDVNNDVCANYQYYQYRYSGMYIGTVDYVDTVGIETIKTAGIVKATKCEYYIGPWNSYWYCELVANSLASYTHDHQFSRLHTIESEAEIKSGDTWTKTGNFILFDSTGLNPTCYHIMKNSEGNLYRHFHDKADESNPEVYETINGNTILKEDRQLYHLPFNQLFTGYGWGSSPQTSFPNIALDEKYDHTAVKKFAQNTTIVENITIQADNTVLLKTGVPYSVGALFKAVDGYTIQSESVQVLLSTENNALKMTYAPNTTDWTLGTVTFTSAGEGILNINDYNYCQTTSIKIAVDSADASVHAAHCTCGETGVGENCDTNKLYGWIAWDGKSDIPSGGNYYLIADVDKDVAADRGDATQHWIGQRSNETGNNENVVINLCLNGHSIGSRNRVFGIGTNVTVNLMNCRHDEPEGRSTLTGRGTYNDGANKTPAQAGLIFIQGNAKLNIYEGIDMIFVDDYVRPTYGGIMSFSGGSVVTMYGGTMEGGKAGVGGSVYISGEGSKFIMYGGTISDGNATSTGGNIYAHDKASVTLSGGTIEDGVATNGGNIYATGSVELTVSGTAALSGGTAHGNGGVAHGGSVTVVENSVLKLSGGTVTGGTVDSEADDENELGGNLYIGESGRLEMTGGIVQNGTAADLGGNIYLAYQSKDNKIEGGQILSGNARTGGNIYADNSSELTISGGKISDGTATSEISEDLCAGGNLATGRASNVTISGGTIADGTAEIGGNIHVSGTEITETGGDGTGVLTITGTASITGGTASVHGGSIYANAYSAITLSGDSVSGGTASGNGGNIYVGEHATVTLNDSIAVSNGTATGNGGNIYGSGVDAKLVINGGSVADGKAKFGGNIYVYKDATFTMADGTISGGEAQDGGSICLCDGEEGAKATFEMTGGTITKGDTTDAGNGRGGNVYVGKYATFTYTNGIISYGEAKGGGNIAVIGEGATLTMTGGTVQNGTSTDAHGGNIFVTLKGTATISGGTVKDGVVKVSEGTTGTDANDKNGGNLALTENGTNVTIKDAQFSGGEANDRAGNIFYHSGNLTIEGNAKITGGKAYGKGYGGGGQCIHINTTVNTTNDQGKVVNAGTLTLSGTPTIDDLHVGDETPFVIDGMSGGSIGLSGGSLYRAIATITNSPNCTQYFTSNNPYYYGVEEKVNANTNANELWYAGHADHCVCGDTLANKNLGDHSCTKTGAEWKPWDGQSNITVGGNYYLASDYITIKDVWMGNSYVAADNTEITINLCLNGHDVTALYRAFKVSPKVTFNLMNCSGTECEVTSPGTTDNNGRIVHVHTGTSTMNMYGNIILQGQQNNVTLDGGVINNNGTFNMYGGTVQGAPASNGGAIYNTGTVNMYDGTINGASASTGGAIYNTGTVHMHGGEIVGAYVGGLVGTTAYAGKGGAIFLGGSAVFNMHDGTIHGGSGGTANGTSYEDNVVKCRSLGGVAYLETNAQFNMYNGTIYGGTVADGGVFFANNKSEINIENGTIYAGYAQYGGGAAKMNNESTFTMTGGEIIGVNDAESHLNETKTFNAGGAGGGALFLEDSSKAVISGNAVIRDCVTTQKGGAIKTYRSTVSITLGGSVQIWNNKSNGTDNNICLASSGTNYAKALILDGLTTSAKIGISMDSTCFEKLSGKFVSEGGVNLAGAFVSDDSVTYKVVDNGDGTLVLQKQ